MEAFGPRPCSPASSSAAFGTSTSRRISRTSRGLPLVTEKRTRCELELATVLAALTARGQVVSASSPPYTGKGRGGLVVDSRKLNAGDCFVVFKGVSSDAHQYIPMALEAKVGLLVVERADAIPSGCSVPHIVVKSGRAAWAYLAAHAFGEPQDEMTVLAVTGTNGKTSTAWMVGELLRGAGLPCLTIGTLGADFGDGPEPTGHTTPDPDILYGLLREALRRGIKHVAMEASSHAVVQDKLLPMRFSATAFTSFSRDHLDFHGTLADYFAAKERIFTQLCRPDARRVLWEGLSQATDIARHGGDVWYYGQGAARLGAKYFAIEQAIESFAGTELHYKASDGSATLHIPYFGKHAVENFCAAYLLATTQVAKIPPSALAAMRHVPGRLQRVSTQPDEPQVIVDYAHTPDALEKTLQVLRPLCKGRLVVVFGCGGDRDRGKRPLMGQAAERLADVIYVSSDNPRSEDPAKIIAEIMSGLSTPAAARAIADRRAAIEQAVFDATPDDTVLVAGKGHETYQIVGKVTLPFDDREVARAALALRRKA
jgi:UDP-N-acetylmuramoyl-L-alanyl-D-glutamate--2,6-diaminopimelate ligase